MADPFDDENGRYLVVANPENQHSLRPAAIPVPAGRETRFGTDTRANGPEYVRTRWTDLRPAGLVASLAC